MPKLGLPYEFISVQLAFARRMSELSHRPLEDTLIDCTLLRTLLNIRVTKETAQESEAWQSFLRGLRNTSEPDRFSRQRLILVGTALGSVSSLLCLIASDWVHLVVLRVLGGVADAISMPALLAITSTLGKDAPGRFFGILRSSQGLSFVVGPAMGAFDSLMDLSLLIAPLLGVVALGMTGEMAYPLLVAVLPAFLALFVTFAFLRESHVPKQLKKTT